MSAWKIMYLLIIYFDIELLYNMYSDSISDLFIYIFNFLFSLHEIDT